MTLTNTRQRIYRRGRVVWRTSYDVIGFGASLSSSQCGKELRHHGGHRSVVSERSFSFMEILGTESSTRGGHERSVYRHGRMAALE